MSIAVALVSTLAFVPPAVPIAPGCTPRVRVALPQPYSPSTLEIRATQLLFTASISGAGVGTNIGALDTASGAVAWLTSFAQFVEQRPVFLSDDLVLYQKFPGVGYEVHAYWFGFDGRPGTADDATWLVESGNGYVSWPDANDDEAAWIVTDLATGLADVHRCDWHPSSSSLCVPGAVVSVPLPMAPFEARNPHPIGGGDILVTRFGSNAVSWLDSGGGLSPWRTTSFVDAIGPFVATWRNPPGVTEIELASNPPGVPWWSLPLRSARLSRRFGSNGHARAIGEVPGGLIGPGRVIDLALGGFKSVPTTDILRYGGVVEGDRIAYVTPGATFPEIAVEDCYFP